MIEFRVLGPVEVVLADQVVPGWRPQQRAVLAALVVDVGRVVPVGVLVDRVWGSAPPRHADRILQSHLSRIRR
ncbi:MAG TPA: winged helix-turn-helix domain-containing protein, partial [Micromonosporaceae bacterium]|nr:winged helix-turn-helix domain-containing protein [Micromonosporaceae bacterium]